MRPSLFVWIPKTAGTSVWAACSEAAESSFYPEGHDGRPESWSTTNDLLCFGHRLLFEMTRREAMLPSEIDRRFRFAFVRNPWDRMVSTYFYARKHPTMREHLKRRGVADFGRFVCSVATVPIDPVWSWKHRGLSIANPQVDWLRGIELNFVGRFEALRESWAELCGHLGIQPGPLPHKKATRHEPYRTYYTQETRELAGRFYREDIERFGYEF